MKGCDKDGLRILANGKTKQQDITGNLGAEVQSSKVPKLKNGILGDINGRLR